MIVLSLTYKEAVTVVEALHHYNNYLGEKFGRNRKMNPDFISDETHLAREITKQIEKFHGPDGNLWSVTDGSKG